MRLVFHWLVKRRSYLVNFVRSWLAENGNRLLFVTGSVICLVLVFPQSTENRSMINFVTFKNRSKIYSDSKIMLNLYAQECWGMA